MKTEKRTITNGNGKTITMMMAPSDTQHTPSEVRWSLTKSQWQRIVRESDNTAWTTESGATILFDCPPFAADCKYPGRA